MSKFGVHLPFFYTLYSQWLSQKKWKYLQNVLQRYTIIPEFFENFKSIRSRCFRSGGKNWITLYSEVRTREYFQKTCIYKNCRSTFLFESSDINKKLPYFVGCCWAVVLYLPSSSMLEEKGNFTCQTIRREIDFYVINIFKQTQNH
jgi:hypothetical protein